MNKYRVIEIITKKSGTFYYAQRRFLGIFWINISDYHIFKAHAIDCITKYKNRKNLPKKKIVYKE